MSRERTAGPSRGRCPGERPLCFERNFWLRWCGSRAGPWEKRSISSGIFNCRSEEHTSELQSHSDLVCRLLLEKKNQQVVRLPPHPSYGHVWPSGELGS